MTVQGYSAMQIGPFYTCVAIGGTLNGLIMVLLVPSMRRWVNANNVPSRMATTYVLQSLEQTDSVDEEAEALSDETSTLLSATRNKTS